MARLKNGELYAGYLTFRRALKASLSAEFLQTKFIFVPVLGPLIHAASARHFTELDKKRLEFYGGLIDKGDLVFDVGANLGNRTKIFLKLGARVVAFEPQKRCARLLKSTFGRNENFELVERALGSVTSRGTIYLSNASPISSMSEEWIDRTSTGRFANYRWGKKQDVEIVTLDCCIADMGTPSFIKIDVEGFEREVLSGLTTPIACLSFEYTPECIESAFQCIELVDLMGESEYQFSIGESMSFALKQWVSSAALREYLVMNASNDFGDIYARLVSAGTSSLA